MNIVHFTSASLLVAGLTLSPFGIAQAQSSSPETIAPTLQSVQTPLEPRPFIIGGREAKISDAPYIAHVDLSGVAECTGQLVAPKWVLTAKHCDFSPYKMTVELGSATKGKGTQYDIVRALRWPDGDLALLELNREHRGPLAVLGKAVVPEKTQGAIFGFGQTAPRTLSQSLKTARVVNEGETKDGYGGAAYQLRGIDGQAWTGDSGGPFVVNGKVVGVASTSQSQGTNITSISKYTRIAEAASWLKSTIGVSVK